MVADTQCLAKKGFTVKSYDVYPPSLALAVKAGSQAAESPKEAATDVQVLGLMVVNALQVEDVLFGSGGVAEGKLIPHTALTPQRCCQAQASSASRPCHRPIYGQYENAWTLWESILA